MGKKRKKYIYNKTNINEVNNFAYKVCSKVFSDFLDSYIDSLCNTLDSELEEFLVKNSQSDFDLLKEGLIAISSYWKGSMSYEEYRDDISIFGRRAEILDCMRLQVEESFSDSDDRIHTLLMVCCRRHMKGLLFVLLDSIEESIKEEVKPRIDVCLDECYVHCRITGGNPNVYTTPVLNNFMHFVKSLKSACATLVLSFLDDVYDNIENQYYEIACISYNMKSKVEKEEVLESLCDLIEDEPNDNKGTYKFIDDYKELNSLAESNGYVYIRSKGDHGIYKNKKGEVVVIPQGRVIGKGLSIRIQKDILVNRGC